MAQNFCLYPSFFSGGVYWTKSEPILSKIQRILRIESRPAFPPASASLRRAKQQNFLKHFYLRAPKIFSIKETKIFLFCLPANAGIAETLSHPQPRFAGQSKRAKIHFPHTPFSFCPLAWGRKKFLRGGNLFYLCLPRPTQRAQGLRYSLLTFILSFATILTRACTIFKGMLYIV